MNIQQINRLKTVKSDLDRLSSIPKSQRTSQDLADIHNLKNFVLYGPSIKHNLTIIKDSIPVNPKPITDIIIDNENLKYL